MRIINVVYRQHIDRMFKKHWRIQGQRVPVETRAEEHLKSLGIQIVDPQELVKKERKEYKLDIVGFAPRPPQNDNTHPDWHDKVCYFHKDDNVLLLGVDQAKYITKTVEIQEGLPQKFVDYTHPTPEVNNRVQEIIKSSHLFDTEQKKLPKIKDPLRPAWNFPRTFGITHSRICDLITSKLLQLCESTSKSVANDRMLVNDAQFFVPLQKEDENILLELKADQMLVSKKPLKNFAKETADDATLPNLHPIHFVNALTPQNIYKFEDICPIKKSILKYHPHTLFVYYDITKVQNLFEEEVTENQILGRTLMKTFAVAASYARAKYGNDVKLLPEPVSLQCVHTDGRMFHFGALQLNTLELDGDGVKNIWYTQPRIPLFGSCEYKVGKPVLLGYNQDVMKYMLAFYNNL